MTTSMVDGVALHEWRPDGPGPLLLFVHGGSHGSWCWMERIIPSLLTAGIPCAALDWYGHGESAGTALPLGRTLNDVADMEITTVLRHYAPRPVILVGHSMGGLAALDAASNPVNGNVVGLCLIAPAIPANIAGKSPRFVPYREDRFYRVHRWPLPLVKALFFPDSSWLDAARYRRRLVPESGRIIRQTVLRELYVPELWRLRRLETTVICGDRDRLVSFAQAMDLSVELAATFRPVSGAGHGLWAGKHWPEVVDSLRMLRERVRA